MKTLAFSLFVLGIAQASGRAQLPTITNQPVSRTVWSGPNVTFTVGVSGAGPFYYQWLHDGTNMYVPPASVVAGGGTNDPGDGGWATSANLDPGVYQLVNGVAVNGLGDIFILDGSTIRKVDPASIITTVVGKTPRNGDGGPAVEASMSLAAVAIGASGNLFIADGFLIRMVDTNGVITTVAGGGTNYPGDGGPAVNAVLNNIQGLAFDAAGNLFVADTGDGRICRVNTSGMITTVAGGGTNDPVEGEAATNANLGNIEGVAVDTAGNLFVADPDYGRVWRVNTSGIITRVAGGGTNYAGHGGAATNVSFGGIQGVAVDTAANLFVADPNDGIVVRVSPNGPITTVAGNGTEGNSGDGGSALAASLYYPGPVAVNAQGELFIVDSEGLIRKVDRQGVITTVAGSLTNHYSGDGGAATKANLGDVQGVAVDAAGSLFIANGNTVRRVDTNGIISTVAGGGIGVGEGGAAVDANLWASGIAADTAGNLFIADGGNARIRKVDASGVITTVAGGGTNQPGDGGPAIGASLAGPGAIAISSSGNLFLADGGGIRKVDTNGIITTVTASYGDLASSTQFLGYFSKLDLAVDDSENVYVATVPDTAPFLSSGGMTNRVVRVDTNGLVTIVADSGILDFSGWGAGTVGLLYGVAVNPAGNLLIPAETYTSGGCYECDPYNTLLLYGFDGLLDTNVFKFGLPYGMAFDSWGSLYVAGGEVIGKFRSFHDPSLTLQSVSSADSGNYQVIVTASGGSSVTSSVAMLNVTTAPLIYAVVRHPDQSVALSFVSQPNSTNFVQVSANLSQASLWQTISTNFSGSDGTWQFIDTNSSNFPSRFYRSATRANP